MDARQMTDRRRLLEILKNVRTRWRLRVAFRGLAIVLAAGTAAFLLSAFGLNALRFAAPAVLGFRLVAWATVTVITYLYLVRPLRRELDDEHVALYLEEYEPSLEATLLAAVEAERSGDRYSPGLVKGLVHMAVQRARAVDNGRRVDQARLYRSGGVFTGVAVAAIALLLVLPAGVHHGLSALLRPAVDVAAVNPYSIAVAPGNIVIARGSDQLVTASLGGFTSSDVTLFTRRESGESFQRLTMLPGQEAAAFELLLLNVAEEADYFVEADGNRSPVFRIDVADLPYVDRLDQELRFPSYTGLPARVVEDGGDVAAVTGTVVAITIHPTIPTAGGQLTVDGEGPGELTLQQDGSLTAAFTVESDGFYRIELVVPDGRMVEASPRYTIDALADQPPQVRVTKPGRDGNASPLEEVYFEAEALDDYGVAQLSLVYSVNGGDPTTVRIFDGSRPPLTEAAAGHTVYLEGLELESGDLVTYWATARDSDRSGGSREVTSDIYFMAIRQLGNEYRQADAPPGGGGGINTQGPEASLSELQKQVIAATFNLDRDRAKHSAQDFSENAASVRLAQEQVRGQVETLVRRMVNRGLSEADEQFRWIAEMLPAAVEAMQAAEGELGEQDVKEALPHQQRALRQLQKAEETYEKYVTLQQQSGGGGGGGGPNAEDLADLFELELDKLRNQYETVQRGERQEQNNQVDEVLQKLQELARRQQQAAARRRLQAQGGSGSSDDQRGLADQTEEMARQLERLARDSRDERMADAARDLQDVANQMRTSAAQGGAAGAAGAAAAADRLAQTQRQLERARQQRLGEDARNAQQRAQELVREEAEVRQEVRQMAGRDPQARAEQVRLLKERKDRMADEVGSLRGELQRMSADAAREGDADAAQKLAGAADEIEERKIREKIAYSKGVVEQRGLDGYAATFEAQIAMDLDELKQQIDDAATALDEAGPRPIEEALDKARDLVRRAETMGRRLEQGQNGQGTGDDRLDPTTQGDGGRPAFDPRTSGASGGVTLGDPPTQALTPDEARDFRREFEQRLGDAEALRRYLNEAGASAPEMSQVIDDLRTLASARPYGDLPALVQLQNELRENLQRLEFRIRREVEGDGSDRAVLNGFDEVPEGFRTLVEEYFRALSRSEEGR
jgi:hypothetical protein